MFTLPFISEYRPLCNLYRKSLIHSAVVATTKGFTLHVGQWKYYVFVLPLCFSYSSYKRILDLTVKPTKNILKELRRPLTLLLLWEICLLPELTFETFGKQWKIFIVRKFFAQLNVNFFCNWCHLMQMLIDI